MHEMCTLGAGIQHSVLDSPKWPRDEQQRQYAVFSLPALFNPLPDHDVTRMKKKKSQQINISLNYKGTLLIVCNCCMTIILSNQLSLW
mgnify:CR=1 FL=1